jgi:hypothetical protein
MRARRKERRPCGPRVAIKRYGQSKAWHAGVGIWTSLGMGERVVLGRSYILSPTSKRSDRFAKRATNSMARCVPVSLRSHGLRAPFLLRFPENLLVITEAPELVKAYEQHIRAHAAHSHPSGR